MLALIKILAIIIGGIVVIFALFIILSVRAKDKDWERAIKESEKEKRWKKY